MIRDERPPLAGGPALDPLGGTATYARVASLPVVVERCELLPLVRDTTSGFTKVSIVVRLSGGGHTGEGEDITWDQIATAAAQASSGTPAGPRIRNRCGRNTAREPSDAAWVVENDYRRSTLSVSSFETGVARRRRASPAG